MSRIPTAKLILTGKETYDKEYSTVSKYDALEAMIEFAKLHVEAALKEASEKATAGQTFVDMGGEFEDIPIYEAYVVKDSILNAYPLENVK